MAWLKRLRARPWLIVGVSVGGLLVAIAIAGLVGIAINRNVRAVTDRAVRYDIELEDEGDDLRVAILDARHYHRNLVYVGFTRGYLEDFDASYRQIQEEIDDLERLGAVEPNIPQAAQIRQLVDEYYKDFRPAIDAYYANRPDRERPPLDDRSPERQAFLIASDAGLARLERLEGLAEQIDEVGERRAEAALGSVERANRSATYLLFGVLGALVLVGAGLAYSVARTVNEVRGLYARQQATAEQLAQALEAKSRALQAKTDFIADASHELRTPITIVRGNAEVGLAIGGAGVQAEVLEEIVKASVRMSRLVEDLLFLARSDAASLPLKPEPISAPELIADIIEPAEVLARQHGARLETALRGEGQLWVDKTRIEQAVLTLVNNAGKYGGAAGPIVLSSDTQGRELRIAVADRGPGIPPADLPKIFERFYRVDKARARKQGGAGLGLTIARTIAEAHRGRIEAHSRVGQGTTFTIYLPLADTPAAGGAARAQPAPATDLA